MRRRDRCAAGRAARLRPIAALFPRLVARALPALLAGAAFGPLPGAG